MRNRRSSSRSGSSADYLLQETGFTYGALERHRDRYRLDSSPGTETASLYSYRGSDSDAETIYHINVTPQTSDGSSSSSYYDLQQRRYSFESRASQNGLFHEGSRSRLSSDVSEPEVKHWCSLIGALFRWVGARFVQALVSLFRKIKHAFSRPRIIDGPRPNSLSSCSL